MSGVVIVGLYWGDEGKGRIVDLLAQKSQVVARYSGGSNAGHTIINDLGEFKLRLVPSGIFNPNTLCVIGNGVVVGPKALCTELNELVARGVSVDGLRISDRAHLVMPYHLAVEAHEEKRRGAGALGTTLNGIGPVYVDKTGRDGIRLAEFIDPALFAARLASILPLKNRILTEVYGAPALVLEEVLAEYAGYRDLLKRFVADTGTLVRDALKAGQRVLLEGAQATMLDVDLGTYPYVTSSHPTAAGACVGAGIAPNAITDVIGIAKAYTTRVGAGPLPTELLNEIGEQIRKTGHEYGTATGRPRRCGWFDAVVGKYAVDVNGVNRIALTRLDILDQLESLSICVGYELDGQRIDTVPASAEAYGRCTPIYEDLPGWQADTSMAREFGDLPANAQRYVNRIEELLGAPVDIIGVGASRSSAIVRREHL